MAGIKDVAKAAGVSVSTVSYVLSGKRSISNKTADRVLDAVNRLNYIPDASARKMRGHLSHVIAIALGRREVRHSSLSAYFMQTALRAKAGGYDVLLLTGEDPVDDILRVAQSNLADGVVLLDVEENDLRAARAAEYGKPCVCIGFPKDHDDCACVDVDFACMGRLAADRLRDLGHERVVLLRSVEHLSEPMSGYLNLFRDSFIAAAEDRQMVVMESELTEYRNFDANAFVSKYLIPKNGATAIVNQADPSVLNTVLGVLSVSGMDVPQYVSVLSCGTLLDSYPMSKGISEMPITPAVQCSRAMSLLLGAIEEHHDIRGEVDLSVPTFIDRGSLSRAREAQKGGCG